MEPSFTGERELWDRRLRKDRIGIVWHGSCSKEKLESFLWAAGERNFTVMVADVHTTRMGAGSLLASFYILYFPLHSIFSRQEMGKLRPSVFMVV